MTLYYVKPMYSYFQEFFLWLKNKTGDAQQNSTHGKEHHQNVLEWNEDNIKQCIS